MNLLSSLLDTPVLLPAGTFKSQKQPWAGVIRSVYLAPDGTPRYTVQVVQVEEVSDGDRNNLIATASFLTTLQDSQMRFIANSPDAAFILNCLRNVKHWK